MRALSLLAVAMILAVAACSKDDSPTAPGDATPSTDRYVDQATGSNANDGSSGAPWATLTYAVSTADTNVTIHVAPGTYNTINNEAFPIRLKKGQTLLGDVASKGAGATPIKIQGESAYPLGSMNGAAVVGADSARVAGFTIVNQTNPLYYAGIAVNGVTMEIDHNTFPNPMYAGINASNGADLDVHDNLFQASAYGLVLDGSGIVGVHDNTMETGGFGIRVFGIDSLDVANNVMHTVAAGVQAGSSTAMTIRANAFDRAAGYTTAAIQILSGAPVIRNNMFTGGPCIRVQATARPDIGTLASPGQNDFSAVSGVAVQHAGSQAVMAIGNTWANDPPQLGVDYTITGTGTVVTQ
jgi:hypothetical protein